MESLQSSLQFGKAKNIKKSFKYLKVAFRNPILFGAFCFATLKAYYISKKKFGELSFKNGPENAFRHALWAGLITKYCLRFSNTFIAARFALKITSLYEELFPNKELEKRMDLHNNFFGVYRFLTFNKVSDKDFINGLEKQMSFAQIISHFSDQNIKNHLIYIEK